MNKTLLTFALGCVIATATAGTAPAADTEKVAGLRRSCKPRLIRVGLHHIQNCVSVGTRTSERYGRTRGITGTSDGYRLRCRALGRVPELALVARFSCEGLRPPAMPFACKDGVAGGLGALK